MKNKEICRETTTRGSGKMGLAYMALLAICCSWAYEGFRFNSTGIVSPVGMLAGALDLESVLPLRGDPAPE